MGRGGEWAMGALAGLTVVPKQCQNKKGWPRGTVRATPRCHLHSKLLGLRVGARRALPQVLHVRQRAQQLVFHVFGLGRREGAWKAARHDREAAQRRPAHSRSVRSEQAAGAECICLYTGRQDAAHKQRQQSPASARCPAPLWLPGTPAPAALGSFLLLHPPAAPLAAPPLAAAHEQQPAAALPPRRRLRLRRSANSRWQTQTASNCLCSLSMPGRRALVPVSQ